MGRSKELSSAAARRLRIPSIAMQFATMNLDRMEGDCPVHDFIESMTVQMWRVNALLMVNVILVAVMVGIGAYGHRYRHRPFTRILYDGASSLFLPIMSYVFSQAGGYFITGVAGKVLDLNASCDAGAHMFLVILWTGLVHIVAINTTATVVGDDREGRNTGPPVVLLVQALWASYLAVYNTWTDYKLIEYWSGQSEPGQTQGSLFSYSLGCLLFLPIAIIISRMILKFYAFYKVRRSFALGNNPRVVVGYMRHLHELASLHSEDEAPPLLVMGEETVQLEEKVHGYTFRDTSHNNMLVTIKNIWDLDDNFLGSTIQFKEVCLSLALFKLLRCRFARYTFAEAGLHKVSNFLWHVLLKDGNGEGLFGVIEDELSFLYDYYYSSLPLSYPNHWLPILSIFISLLSISYCLFAATTLTATMKLYSRRRGSLLWGHELNDINAQVKCEVECEVSFNKAREILDFGSLQFDFVPVYLLLLLVVLTEAREIACYIYSNWTKVALVCRYVNNPSWRKNIPTLHKCVGFVLRCRCKLLKHWQDKMNQRSILMLHPRKTPLGLLWRLIRVPLPDKKKRVQVPTEVKSAVIDALRRSRSNGMVSLPRTLKVGDNLNWWMSNCEGTADTMLVCHIATTILEVRSHQHISKHKIVATHLSKYCAYLAAYSAELLPDDNAWCKNLYKDVKKDAERVVAGAAWVSRHGAEHHQWLANLLIKESKHHVLRHGAELGKRLAEVPEGEETAWNVLAGFWSEMILYVAPSDNINGHADAIARGGELITLLWALLAHLGIDRGPDDDAAGTAS